MALTASTDRSSSQGATTRRAIGSEATWFRSNRPTIPGCVAPLTRSDHERMAAAGCGLVSSENWAEFAAKYPEFAR